MNNIFINSRERRIAEFHEKFGVAVQEEATEALLELRWKLIDEEASELLDAIESARQELMYGNKPSRDLWIEILDGMADLQVVLSGTAVAVKELRNFDVAFYRVHDSNMSKLGENGKPFLREDGKVLKGPNYKPPQLDDLVD